MNDMNRMISIMLSSVLTVFCLFSCKPRNDVYNDDTPKNTGTADISESVRQNDDEIPDAQQGISDDDLKRKDITVTVDGKPVDSTEAIISGGTTYIPVRDTVDESGITVEWDDEDCD